MTPTSKRYRKEYAPELLKIAKGDLGSARALIGAPDSRPENVCYLTQQSVEKCLKAVICHLGIEVIHTHNLESLIQLIPAEHRPSDQKQLEALTEYATVRRYEEGFEILTQEDLERVVALGKQIYLWAETIIKKSK